MSLSYYTSDGQTPGSTDPRIGRPRINRPLQFAGQGRRAWAKHYPGVLCAVHDSTRQRQPSGCQLCQTLYTGNLGLIIGWLHPGMSRPP